MKSILAAIALTASALAQEASVTPKRQIDVASPRAAGVNTNSLGLPRLDAMIEKPRTRKGGVLANWRKGDKPLKVLSLRNPADPLHDGENLVMDLPTATRRGIKLFSLDF